MLPFNALLVVKEAKRNKCLSEDNSRSAGLYMLAIMHVENMKK